MRIQGKLECARRRPERPVPGLVDVDSGDTADIVLRVLHSSLAIEESIGMLHVDCADQDSIGMKHNDSGSNSSPRYHADRNEKHTKNCRKGPYRGTSSSCT